MTALEAGQAQVIINHCPSQPPHAIDATANCLQLWPRCITAAAPTNAQAIVLWHCCRRLTRGLLRHCLSVASHCPFTAFP